MITRTIKGVEVGFPLTSEEKARIYDEREKEIVRDVVNERFPELIRQGFVNIPPIVMIHYRNLFEEIYEYYKSIKATDIAMTRTVDNAIIKVTHLPGWDCLKLPLEYSMEVEAIKKGEKNVLDWDVIVSECAKARENAKREADERKRWFPWVAKA